MKINVEKDVLLKGLQKVTNIIGNKTTMPILANILVNAHNNTVSLTTTDLEVRISTIIPAMVAEEGITTIPAKKLITLVSKLRGKNIVITSNENFHSIVECETAKIMLVGIAPDGYPSEPEFTEEKTLRVNSADICSMISKVSYCASLDDSRRVLQGVQLSISNSMLNVAATDGKRLSMVEKPLPEGAMDAAEDFTTIVTLKFATELGRVVEESKDLYLKFSQNMIKAEYGDTMILSKIIDGRFPNVQSVIPKEFRTSIALPSDQVIYAMDILGITMSETKTPAVKLNFQPGELVFEGSCTTSEGFETIPIDYNGPEMTAAFNPIYLIDPFKHVPVNQMYIRMNDVFSPVVLDSNDGFICVIMPMRNK